MKRSKQVSGAIAFEAYYGALFGERWQTLRTALLHETQPVPFSVSGEKPYYLDQASIYAAQALPPVDEGACLDMCAAPGGKTLVLASHIGQDVQIQANELSRARRARLLTVLADHLPPDNRSRIEVTGYDAAILPRYRQACYDRILLDAPCSSERHVITDAKYLACWTPARIKMLAQRQWALLSAAFLLLKQGGFLVYATCALTDAENDGVVQKLLKKYGNAVAVRIGRATTNTETSILSATAVVHQDGASNETANTESVVRSSIINGTAPAKTVSAVYDNVAVGESAVANNETADGSSVKSILGEKTLFGCRFLPDICAGAGPLYFSLIEKLDNGDSN